MRNVTLFKLLLVGMMGLFIAGCYTTYSKEKQPLADQRNLIKEVRIAQQKINNDKVAFEDLFYAGKHIFSNRFTTDDHYGDGPDGPRRHNQKFGDRGDYPFLRFNGLDSQSCLECHLAIGFAPQRNYDKHSPKVRFPKQPDFVGGGAGFASNAFGLPNFACGKKTEDCNPDEPTVGVVRNPPHAFGAGYTQKLAQEMTWELQAIREDAQKSGKVHPLKAKGISFGTVAVNPNGTINEAKSQIEGVSHDLVVRPFQWRGLASNLRNFITGAMDFHFSVQPKELLDKGAIDDDKDTKTDEILEGEISAVAAFLAFLRPPTESSHGLDPEKVKRGREVFQSSKCASCHVPSLHIKDPFVTIRDPKNDPNIIRMIEKDTPYLSHTKGTGGYKPSLTVAQELIPSLGDYTLLKAIKDKKPTQKMINDWFHEKVGGFTRDLNSTDGPGETLPRLPNHKGKIVVPLYSDLKRHKMGTGLKEPFPQETDGGPEHKVAGNEFLTRPLWGVADTAPWLHDGRALTLTEAIVMHKGPESEANDSIALFQQLSADDQKAMRYFLSSLRLPVSK